MKSPSLSDSDPFAWFDEWMAELDSPSTSQGQVPTRLLSADVHLGAPRCSVDVELVVGVGDSGYVSDTAWWDAIDAEVFDECGKTGSQEAP